MRQLVELNNTLPQFDALNTTIVAISADTPDKTLGLSKRIGSKIPLIADPDERIAKRYAADIKGAAMYFIRPDGTIHYGYTDPPNYLDRPPLAMVLELAKEAGDPKTSPRTSEFDAPCRPHKGIWICPE